ncbi:phage portal protein [Mesorhizobium huakuii]|uniref:Phage portal protein n=1 Tax=Mesorhizobium huakuii TaxID=28104 RepID=A0ABZ0VTD6_9HYPH|nr:phage portal protein [Mesorhizobium huakuii]WQB99539.1 phage portal protein [Mesorhizobium huakuii]
MGLIAATRKLLGLSTRRYDGATGAKNRFEGGRATFNTYATEISAARSTVQGRARHVVANNALAGAAKEAWATAVAGPGLIPTSQHPDLTTRAALDAYFAKWAKRADVTGRSNFGTLTAKAVGDEFVDGEAFGRWIGDQLQAIPAEQVASDLTTMLSDGRQIVNGVEIDADGRVLAYHIHPARPTDVFATYAPPVRIDAADVLHLGQFETGAYRAISKFAPVLLRLDALDGIEDAQALNVRMAALLSVILTNENDTSADDPLQEGAGLAPGAILKIPGGWKVTSTAPQQAQQSAELVQHMIRTIAAGLGIPVHLVDGNLTQANYSSLRAALVSFRQKIDAYQFNVLQPLWLDPVWRRVATAAVLSGEIDAKLDDDLFAAEWIPPAQPWVDPMKDLQAQILAIENGLMSRKQAVAAQGYSIDKLDAEIAAHPPVAKPQSPENPKETQP